MSMENCPPTRPTKKGKEMLCLYNGNLHDPKSFQGISSSTHVWNDAVLLARERYEPNDATVAKDVPVPALDLYRKQI